MVMALMTVKDYGYINVTIRSLIGHIEYMVSKQFLKFAWYLPMIPMVEPLRITIMNWNTKLIKVLQSHI
jgi:hypothetical protein